MLLELLLYLKKDNYNYLKDVHKLNLLTNFDVNLTSSSEVVVNETLTQYSLQ